MFTVDVGLNISYCIFLYFFASFPKALMYICVSDSSRPYVLENSYCILVIAVFISFIVVEWSYKRKEIKPPLIKIMACRLFGT